VEYDAIPRPYEQRLSVDDRAIERILGRLAVALESAPE